MDILFIIVSTAIVLLIVLLIIYNASLTTDDDIEISKGNYRIKMIKQKDGRIRYIPEENSDYGWRSLCSDWQWYYSKEEAIDRIKGHAATLKYLENSKPVKTEYEYL